MIVIAKIKGSGKTFKKVQVRDRTFLEVDASNKKISGVNNQYKISDIDGIIGINSEKQMAVVPVTEWLNRAHETMFWNTEN
jgi:hypothetical protein